MNTLYLVVLIVFAFHVQSSSIRISDLIEEETSLAPGSEPAFSSSVEDLSAAAVLCGMTFQGPVAPLFQQNNDRPVVYQPSLVSQGSSSSSRTKVNRRSSVEESSNGGSSSGSSSTRKVTKRKPRKPKVIRNSVPSEQPIQTEPSIQVEPFVNAVANVDMEVDSAVSISSSSEQTIEIDQLHTPTQNADMQVESPVVATPEERRIQEQELEARMEQLFIDNKAKYDRMLNAENVAKAAETNDEACRLSRQYRVFYDSIRSYITNKPISKEDVIRLKDPDVIACLHMFGLVTKYDRKFALVFDDANLSKECHDSYRDLLKDYKRGSLESNRLQKNIQDFS